MIEQLRQLLSSRHGVAMPAFVWLCGVAAGSLATITVVGFSSSSHSDQRGAIQVAMLVPSDAAPASERGKTEEEAAEPDQAAPEPERDAPAAEAAPAPEPEPDSDETRVLTVRQGDTLMKLMLDADIPRDQAHAAITALRKVYDPRDLMPGQIIQVSYRPKGPDIETAILNGFDLSPDVERVVTVVRDEDSSFHAIEKKKVLSAQIARASGTIESSLYVDGLNAGIPLDTLIELIRIYSWDVDFQREIRPGDGFDVVYERLHDESGAFARNGAILYARLTLSGQDLPLYRYDYDRGLTDYFDREGHSARKPLMRTPIDGARLSSGYGRRRHPILGYTKMHRGVDFAAPLGTPIYAAGDGRVEIAGRNGGYGRYIRIRHNSRYKTAYAHLSRFAHGIRSGTRVRQGQVIGYVGSTGLSTGAHLHFEIHVDGRQVNPRRVKMPSGHVLKGKALAQFTEARETLDREVAELRPAASVARSE